MKEERHTKFVVIDRKKFIKTISPKNNILNKIGDACRDASERLSKQIKDKKGISKYHGKFSSSDNIYRNLREVEGVDIEFTIPVLKTLLCFFFLKKPPKYDYLETHTIDNLKDFFSFITIRNHKEKDRNAFKNFIADIDLIKDQIAPPFNNYDYKIDENWEFSILEKPIIPSDSENSQVSDFESKTSSEDIVDNDIMKNIITIEHKSPTIIINNKLKKWHLVFLALFGLLIIGFLFYNNYRNAKQQVFEKKVVEENKIIENANIIKTTRTPQLISLYDAINKELKQDYKKDNIRNLSPELIGQIITLSEEMKPYLYIKNDKLIEAKLSPERANLFATLYKSNLSQDTFEYIVGEANFMYSDFDEYDLSGLRLTDGLYGIERKEDYSLFNFIVTPAKRGRFHYSNFNNVNLKRTKLFGDFSFCTFKNTVLQGTHFYWSELQGSDFSFNTLDNSSFIDSNIRHANFRNTNFTKGSNGFYSCDLRGTIFDFSTFANPLFPTFHKCLLGSKGTFFNYNIQIGRNGISLYGTPFIIDTTITNKSINITQHFNTLDITEPIDDWYYKENLDYKLHPSIVFTGSTQQKEKIFSELNNFNFFENLKDPLYYYIVKTDDHYNIDGYFYSPDFETEYLFSEFKDKFHLDSILHLKYPKINIMNNNITISYDKEVVTFEKNRNSSEDGIASFIGCVFNGTSFKNSSMYYVSFKDSEIYENKLFGIHGFNNVKLKGNDFRIKNGTLLFDKQTTYDNLILSSRFPIKYISD